MQAYDESVLLNLLYYFLRYFHLNMTVSPALEVVRFSTKLALVNLHLSS